MGLKKPRNQLDDRRAEVVQWIPNLMNMIQEEFEGRVTTTHLN